MRSLRLPAATVILQPSLHCYSVQATGYSPDLSWLHVPALDRKGRIRHDGGVVDAPGLYLLGMQFLRRRKSALIDGAGDDARDLSDHLVRYLDERSVLD